jgi:integrase
MDRRPRHLRRLRRSGDAEAEARRLLAEGRSQPRHRPAAVDLFNDAASAEAGRLVDRNPFAKLRQRSSRGRRDIQPPGQAEIARFVTLADELMPPTFAAYLNTAVYEGMRPGELDALRWTGSTSRPAQSSSTSSGTRRPASSRRRNTAGYARSR